MIVHANIYHIYNISMKSGEYFLGYAISGFTGGGYSKAMSHDPKEEIKKVKLKWKKATEQPFQRDFCQEDSGT